MRYEFNLTEDIETLNYAVEKGDRVFLSFEIEDNKPTRVKIEVGRIPARDFLAKERFHNTDNTIVNGGYDVDETRD